MNKQKQLTPLLSKNSILNHDDSELHFHSTSAKSKEMLNGHLLSHEKIKSNPSFSLDKISTRTIEIAKVSLLTPLKKRDSIKLPFIRTKVSNPEEIQDKSDNPKVYYQSSLNRCLRKHETTYLMNLYRQHFYQCVEVFRFGRNIKVAKPRKQIKLHRKHPELKTVFLDMDETLIHCDQRSNNFTVKLNFPLDHGGTLAAGIKVRPYCQQFLSQLSQFAEIIIFTASSASYADVVLDYLDPQYKWISHRLYRQHCTLEKGFYLKDLRVVDRKPEHSVLVDNSPYCHILQPENAIPMLPFYSFTKDKELIHLLPFLKMVLSTDDTRIVLAQTFFWEKYFHEAGDPRKIFLKNFQKNE